MINKYTRQPNVDQLVITTDKFLDFDVQPCSIFPETEKISIGTINQEEHLKEDEIVKIENKWFFPGKTEEEIAKIIKERQAMDMVEALGIIASKRPELILKEQIPQNKIRTLDVVDNLLRCKASKNLKHSSLQTESKRLRLIAKNFEYLTTDSGAYLDFLNSFQVDKSKGDTGRYRQTIFDYLDMLLEHAVKFGFPETS